MLNNRRDSRAVRREHRDRAEMALAGYVSKRRPPEGRSEDTGERHSSTETASAGMDKGQEEEGINRVFGDELCPSMNVTTRKIIESVDNYDRFCYFDCRADRFYGPPTY